MTTRRAVSVVAALLVAATLQAPAFASGRPEPRPQISKPHDVKRDRAPWISRSGVRGVPSAERLVDLREAARALARAQSHLAVQRAFLAEQQRSNSADLGASQQRLRDRQGELDLAQHNMSTALQNLEVSIERHPEPPSRPQGIGPSSLANERPLGLIPDHAAPGHGAAQRQGWADQHANVPAAFDPAMMPQRLEPREGRPRRAPIASPAEVARGELAAMRAVTEGNRDVKGGWEGRSGSVSLNSAYDIEYTSQGHLYGRTAAEYKRIYDQLGGADKPSFESWCADLRNLPKDSPLLRDMKQRARGAELPTEVRYLKPAERAGYALRVDQGTGQISIGAEPLNKAEQGPVVFVVDANNTVYAGNYKAGSFHHSSLLAGGNVRSAGELLFDANGRLTTITDKSGHYAPDKIRVLQGLDALEKSGVNLDGVALRFMRGTEGFEAKSWLEHERWRLDDRNQGPIDTPAAEALLRDQPAGSWLLRVDGDDGKISYKAPNGTVQHVPLNTFTDQAGAQHGNLLDTAVGGLHLEPTRMLSPATRPHGLLLLPRPRGRQTILTEAMRMAA